MDQELVRAEPVSIKNHRELDENWIKDIVAGDPSILGLGKLVLWERERPQPSAGRLDLLFQEVDSERRYEVEVQLGATDESHIIRTIEYWDIERKRYPHYEHTAVIVAEAITGRFFNVISLFNGAIPIIAIQMTAYRVEGKLILTFTKVMDVWTFGPEEEQEYVEPADRSYWETKIGTVETVAMADELFGMLHCLDDSLGMNYRKSFIGILDRGRANNFVTFVPRKSKLNVDIKLGRSDEVERELEEAGIDLTGYSSYGAYGMRLGREDVDKHRDLLAKYLKMAHDTNKK